jgi:hypothetical protein
LSPSISPVQAASRSWGINKLKPPKLNPRIVQPFPSWLDEQALPIKLTYRRKFYLPTKSARACEFFLFCAMNCTTGAVGLCSSSGETARNRPPSGWFVSSGHGGELDCLSGWLIVGVLLLNSCFGFLELVDDCSRKF